MITFNVRKPSDDVAGRPSTFDARGESVFETVSDCFYRLFLHASRTERETTAAAQFRVVRARIFAGSESDDTIEFAVSDFIIENRKPIEIVTCARSTVCA